MTRRDPGPGIGENKIWGKKSKSSKRRESEAKIKPTGVQQTVTGRERRGHGVYLRVTVSLEHAEDDERLGIEHQYSCNAVRGSNKAPGPARGVHA
jgi:hypothetical protein